MKRLTHFIFFFPVFLLLMNEALAQNQDAETLHETARSLMRQGDFENALQVLNKAITLKPDDIGLLKDEAFVYYLQRDFSNAIQIGKTITTRDDADIQSYQILGLAYKAIAEEKESDKMYKTALKKFPNSGVLYSEYGDLLSNSNNTDLAIKQWENGIKADPNYSGNYYYASKYYAQKGNIIWGLLYGEIFTNIESRTPRTEEIKKLLLGGYQKLFAHPEALDNARQNGTPFEKAVAANLAKLNGIMGNSVSPESLTALHTRFILNWDSTSEAAYPFRLFEQYRNFLQEGIFEAYNQWLIGAENDTKDFENWTKNHPEQMQAYQQYQQNVLFKIPEGQYYNH